MANTSLIVAGSRITAALIQSVAPLCVIKAADQSLTSNTTLQNDNALTLPVVAGATYKFWCSLDYEGGTQGSSDIKWTWSLPASATLRYYAPRTTTAGAAAAGGEFTGAQTIAAGTGGTGNLFGTTMTGTLVVSSTAGSITLQWAQNTSNGTATIVHAQSDLTLWRIT